VLSGKPRQRLRHDHPFKMRAKTSGCKYRAAPDKAMTAKEDNDTPVQSQSEREKTVAGNEGGSVRTTVGVKLPWSRYATDRLMTSLA